MREHCISIRFREISLLIVALLRGDVQGSESQSNGTYKNLYTQLSSIL